MAATLVPMDGGAPVLLEKPIVLIGRHQECDIPLPTHAKVSRRHCCIVQAGERYVVRDLGSMNGLRVNGHRVMETELQPGDELSVADAVFIFRGSLRSAPRPSTDPLSRPDATESANHQAELETPRVEIKNDRSAAPRGGGAADSPIKSDSQHGQKFVEV